MPKHCPLCNRSSNEAQFYGEFCKYCYIGRLKANLPKEVEIERCSMCGRIKVGGNFAGYNDSALAAAAKKHLKGYEIKVRRKGAIATALLRRETEHGDVGFDYDFGIVEKKVLCSSCGRKLSGYYEAVVQLRGNRERFGRLMAGISSYLDANGSFISKIEDVNGGVDVFAGSKKLVREFLAMNRYNASTSYTLWGVRRGKKIYRNIYAIHL